ncbi:MAG: response regulator transcription factor [Clostridia bacterium]|nr:response regulator transcription factor [Clostridia bacterium]
MKILVVEDEESIRKLLEVNLKREGYDVYVASTGEEGLEIIEKTKINIALLDWMLPGIQGIDVCKKIKESSKEVGIIMLTAKAMEDDKVLGLKVGADDYVSKPFSVNELMARVEALGRRINGTEKEVEIKGIKLNLEERTIYKEGKNIQVTPTEYEIIKLLFLNKDKAVSRDEVLDEIWGVNYVGDLKIVDVNIRRIRSKIEEDDKNPKIIETVWGYGYKVKESE